MGPLPGWLELIREALRRLVGKGFVHAGGPCGIRVPPLSLADLEDPYRYAGSGGGGIRQAIARGDDAWEAGIVAAFHRLEKQALRFGTSDDALIVQYDGMHRGFYAVRYAGVVSPRLITLHANLFDQAFRYRKTLHRKTLSHDEIMRELRNLMEIVLQPPLCLPSLLLIQ